MASLALAKLVNRKLIRISGPDCYSYLQSLFCNDLRYLYEPDRLEPREHAHVSSSVLSSFMLNAQGRVMCDILIYRTPNTRYQCEFTPPGEAKDHDELLIECDSGVASGLANTLYGYRVRRKISLEIMQNQSIWCLFPRLNNNRQQSTLTDINETTLINTSNELASVKEVVSDEMTLVADPRLKMMGLRILNYDANTTSQEETEFNNLKQILKSQINVHIDQASVKDYIVHRYQIGVGEGPNDHPEANCLPLECNADLLGSVSFNKGCYLGQELTARIHFTGAVRKRLMPVLIHKETKQSDFVPVTQGTDIVDEQNGKKIGILRHVVRGRALALLRHDLLDNQTTSLIHEGSQTKISTWRPYWWHHNHSSD